jgi:hypothetical protein
METISKYKARNPNFRESVRRKSQVVYCCAAVMLFCRVAVNSKTAALQDRSTATQRTTPDALPLTDQSFDIRISEFSTTLMW